MKHILVPAIAGLALLSSPVSAHNGLVHDGCPADQVFTSGAITVTGAYSRAMLPQAKVAGGYLVVTNTGTEPDRLIGGATAAAATVQVHQMTMDGDMMKMAQVEGGLEIPAGGEVALTPGGYHVMMMGVGTPFAEGECLELTLEFEKAGDLPVVLSIGGTAADAPPEGHAHH